MAISWRSLSLRRKLYVSSGALLCIFAVWLAIELVFINRQANVVSDTMTLRLTQGEAEELRHWLLWTDDKGAYAILSESTIGTSRFTDDYNHGMDTIRDVLRRLDAAPLDRGDRPLLAQFKSWLSGYDAETRRSFAAMAHGDEAAARRIYVSTPTQPGDDIVDRLTMDLHERLDRASANMIADAQFTLLVTGIAGFVAIVLGILVATVTAEVLSTHGDGR